MKFSLSTNYLNNGGLSGSEIAERTLALGFEAVEIGFRTTEEQARELAATGVPIVSVHAFAPLPISAPEPSPGVYQLASFSDETAALGAFHVARCVRFAAAVGADTVVLHGGHLRLKRWFREYSTAELREAVRKDATAPAFRRVNSRALALRRACGRRLLKRFLPVLDSLQGVLAETGVTLALENLPFLEAFPDHAELKELVARYPEGRVRGWFDTGHHRVRSQFGWTYSDEGDFSQAAELALYAGMHLNDVVDYDDDHLAPGGGKVDFAALKPLAQSVGHVVFEPSSSVDAAILKASLAEIKEMWKERE